MRLTSEQVASMCLRYQSGDSAPTLAIEYGVSHQAIWGLLSRRGLARDKSAAQIKHSLNHNAFDAITEESAYWAGFLMADGSINLRTSGANEIALVLATKDAAHIDKLRAFLGSTHKVVHLAKQDAVRFSVRSNKLVSSLERWSIGAKKSHTACVIELEHNRHFWRGVIDGDGYFNLTSNPAYWARLDLVGSQQLLEQFLVFAKHIVPQSKATVRPHKSIYRVGFSCQPVAAILDHLYSDCSIALDRKRNAAINILARATGERPESNACGDATARLRSRNASRKSRKILVRLETSDAPAGHSESAGRRARL